MDQPTPPIPPAPGEAGPPRTSLAARLMNVFATPGEVFEEVRASLPCAANWWVPAVIYGLIGAVAAFLIFSQPAILQKIREQREKMFEEQVKAGKMSQPDADRMLAASEKFSGPAVLKAVGAAGAMVGSFAGIFCWALLLWLIGRFCLKSPVAFMKLAEVAGLASAISSLEAIVKMLLVVSLSNPLASTSLAMAIQNPDPQSKLFMLLNLIDIMTFWALAVRAIGLAKLSRVPFAKAATWVFGVWLLLNGCRMMLLIGIQSAFGQ